MQESAGQRGRCMCCTFYTCVDHSVQPPDSTLSFCHLYICLLLHIITQAVAKSLLYKGFNAIFQYGGAQRTYNGLS
jgi:hypothetical protein